MQYHRSSLTLVAAAILLTIVSACSTQKNTSASRWWHAFNARYNTYYNGSVAYIDGSLEKENGNKDNFTELIPLYTVGNKASRELGKSNFNRAIEKAEKAIHLHSIKHRPVWDKHRRKTAKDIEWLNRREYNPFLWKAWMLMGRAQFYKGDFDAAASTFSYMSRLYSTQPAIYGKARAWLAKAYVEGGWLYDAEDVIRNMARDSIDWRAVKEWNYTYADYYLHTKEYQKAVPYLQKVIKQEMRRKQKAREWYLMGQLMAALGKRDSAYKAYQHVIRLSPPYELEFNARVSQSEVLAVEQAAKSIKKLKRMAASENNKEFLDQVYYALGNIYLAQKDTLNAIRSYEKGDAKSTRNGIEKGVLLLRLGDLYWERNDFSNAQRCYEQAIGLLDKDRSDYQQLSERSKVLDELVPNTEAVHLQDSLQSLALMSETDRNAAIDRVIEALKKQEKAQQDALAEQQAGRQQGQDMGDMNLPPTQRNAPIGPKKEGLWYFYNPMAVAQGKETFQKQWGKRENVDNWQRLNRTVVATAEEDKQSAGLDEDMLPGEGEEVRDSMQQVDSLQGDPHERAFYLAQIPFTPDQLKASNAILEAGLYNAGVIIKDKIGNLPLAEKYLRRLVDNYNDYPNLPEAYYHLFLLYARMGRTTEADVWVQRLKKEYPTNAWTRILADPNYAENAKLGVQMEDSLYAATYNAFKAGRYAEVQSNLSLSTSRFPTGANRDKFLFIGGLGKLNSGDAAGALADMQTVVNDYPDSRLAEMAGMMVNGVKAGRRLQGGKFDLGSVWSRRTEVLNDSDSIAARQFDADRNAAFLFMMVYHPDSVNEHKLLFEMARYNFTNFLVRNFEITIDDDGGLHRMLISGFRNYDEALQYARQLRNQQTIRRLIAPGRTLIISPPNLELLGTRYSYDDYDKFYAAHFAPLKVSTFRLLAEPEEIVTRKNAPVEAEDIEKAMDDGLFIDNGLNVEMPESDTYVVPEKPEKAREQGATTVIAEPKTTAENPSAGVTIIPQKQDNVRKQPDIIVPSALPQAPTDKPSGIDLPAAKPLQGTPKVAVPPVKPAGKVPVQPADTAQKKKTLPEKKPVSKTGIYFDDAKTDTKTKAGKADEKAKKPSATTKKKTFDIEDDYYDLGGF